MHDHLPGLLAAMADPAFYPHPVRAVERRDTHASHVFLTGDVVYKLKKPVDFGFLDYSTLEKRRRCCDTEVHLNRRLTHGVYQDVVPLTREHGGYAVAGNGPVVEYAVRMRQLGDRHTLTYHLSAGLLTKAMIADLARKLSVFYRPSVTQGPPLALGSWDTVRFNCQENFAQTESFRGRFIDGSVHGFIREATNRFLHTRRACFQRRVNQGFIRDCHGDLRCDHVYFDNGIQILDCIEFNRRFRYTDVAADLGFLTMDLDVKGAPASADHLIASYAAVSGDHGIYALLDFYKCYRAFVRGKVNCLQLAHDGNKEASRTALRRETTRYFAWARWYALRMGRPLLWIFCGLPASGKSTQARGVAEALQVPWLRSDVIRKELAGAVPYADRVTAFKQGIYTTGFTDRTYAQMNHLAQYHLAAGRSVVLDGTFSQAAHRREVTQLATRLGVPLLWVVCQAPDVILQRRLFKREGRTAISDARAQHWPQIKSRWEPLDEIAAHQRLTVDTRRPKMQVLGGILARGYQQLGQGLGPPQVPMEGARGSSTGSSRGHTRLKEPLWA